MNAQCPMPNGGGATSRVGRSPWQARLGVSWSLDVGPSSFFGHVKPGNSNREIRQIRERRGTRSEGRSPVEWIELLLESVLRSRISRIPRFQMLLPSSLVILWSLDIGHWSFHAPTLRRSDAPTLQRSHNPSRPVSLRRSVPFCWPLCIISSAASADPDFTTTNPH